MDVRKSIIAGLKQAVEALGVSDFEPELSIPTGMLHGDYTTNVALILFKKYKVSSIKYQVYKSPLDLANKIVEILNTVYLIPNTCSRIEAAPPGFVNFFLSADYLGTHLQTLLSGKEKVVTKGKPKKIMLEFAHPNTHKEFHIGHLRNITLGEAIARLLQVQGIDLKRVNYQGDVGMHVAKAIFGVQHLGLESARKLCLDDKAKFLGKAYALGSKFYEEDEKAKAAILAINKQIYSRDAAIMDLWKETRQWSLDYFDSIYKRLGTVFDRFYFESEVYEAGKKVVLANVANGIFEKSDGAIIFNGEKYGLHKRVFVTSEGNPTYEGKEMGLGPLEYKEMHFDKAVHLVGPEQAGYFTVVFKALECLDPVFEGKQQHLSYGFVKLKEGKMSSRMGNVVSGVWLLEEAKNRLQNVFPEMTEETLEQVAVGAVKYAMLKFARESDIQFSFDESVSLEGNSGPYIQYTFARTQSILQKAGKPALRFRIEDLRLEIEESGLLRQLVHFDEVVEAAGNNFAPQLLCNYLFELAQGFNLFYQKHKILTVILEGAKATDRISNEDSIASLQNDIQNFRLALTAGVGKTLKNGLELLGIQSPEKM